MIQSRPRALIAKSRPVSMIAKQFVDELCAVADEFVTRLQTLMQPTV